VQNAIDRPLIVDASVLIDYRDTDFGILSLFSEHVQPCYVNLSTLHKVRRITESQAARHGLQVLMPDMEIAIFAAEQKGKGSLAPDDWETILLAEEKSLICLTNDKGMRAKEGLCEFCGVWSL
jgi:hypothetical protein